jgi:aminomethyltransferase
MLAGASAGPGTHPGPSGPPGPPRGPGPRAPRARRRPPTTPNACNSLIGLSTSAAETSLRRTSLYEQHRQAGARLVPFAGWEMPVQYVGIKQEHLAVRRDVGVFDVSHMGQVQTRGPQALAFLQRVLSGDVRPIPAGGAQYGVMCREDGGILDDLITYRLADCEFLTVTNAANHEKDLAWMRAQTAEFDVDVLDVADRFAMLAVQGPRARELVRALADGELPARMHCCQRQVGDEAVLVCGTGYTGEDGVELLLDPDRAAAVWQALLSAGAEPVGLGARDTLRMEACLHLYGNDMTEERNPIEAGLGWCCKEHTGFIGSETVAAVRAAGPDQKLVPFTIEGQGIPRAGNPIVPNGQVTSGTFSPCLERGIGLGYVPAGSAEPGTKLEIDVRGTIRPAVVQRKPLYRKDRT